MLKKMSRFVGGSLVASGSTGIVRFGLRDIYGNYFPLDLAPTGWLRGRFCQGLPLFLLYFL
jgi:hypothetical protein